MVNSTPPLLKHVTHTSDTLGPHVLFLGAIHGDEPCGTHGINKVLSEFESGALKLKRGTVTFVPICNPDAHAQNIRRVEKNLNRIIFKHENPQINEERFANEVCDFITAADYLIDLHSFETKGKPMIFLDHPTPTMAELCNYLDANIILYGWDNVYADQKELSDSTETWAHKQNTQAITYECGTNGTVESNVNAYNAIRRSLTFFDMTNQPTNLQKTAPHHIEMVEVVMKNREGEFLATFNDVSQLTKGTKIARYADGEVLTMPYDGYILLSKPSTPIGKEWYYLGKPAKI